MLPKINNEQQKQSADNKAGDVSKEEIRAENRDSFVQQLGNEGMNNILNSPFVPDDKYDIPDPGDRMNDENKNNIIKNDARSDSEDDDDSENENIISTKSNQPDRKKNEDAKDIIQEKDPLKIIEKAPDDLLTAALDEVEEANPDLDRSMVVEPPKRKKEEEEPARVEEVEDDMKPAAGFPFHPVKIAKRKQAHGGDRFLTGLAQYAGQTVGKALGVLCNALYWTIGYLPIKVYKLIKGTKSKPRIKPEEFEKSRRHDLIQGWDGRKFQEQIKGERDVNDPIDVDFRKIPGVWAQLIAAAATDKSGKPLDPIITIYVNEPGEKNDKTYDHGIGHTFIGLEFSHFSRTSNRFERYITKYGLFAPGGENASSYISGLYKNATVPAQLLNDKDYRYSISQSFPAKPNQVNDIMKASETYADKGYRLFERNCTTFVRDMVIRTAHITEAEHILKPEEIKMTNLMNFGLFGAAAFSMNASLGMKHLFGELGAQDDMSYERIGNKRTNKEEYDRYQKSLENGHDWEKYGMSPNTAAENMRRVKSSQPALINARDYEGMPGFDGNAYTLEDIVRAYNKDSDKLLMKLDEITPQQIKASPDVPWEFHQICGTFMLGMEPISDILTKIDNERQQKGIAVPIGFANYDSVTLDDLRESRKKLMGTIKDLNTLLFKYYQNDDRIHLPVLHLIALLNRGISVIDETYRGKIRGRKNPGDLGNKRESMERDNQTVTAGGQSVEITGSHYESYLQIFKTPEAAVAKYKRYSDLVDKKNSQEGLTKAEEKELDKLTRIDKLADDFDNSHRYMLDKYGYRQQEIDYAFSLGVKERQNGATGNLFEKHETASDIYKASFLERIFGGMRQRLLATAKSQVLTQRQLGESQRTAEWLNSDLSAAVTRKMDGVRMIIKGLKRSLGDPNREQLFEAVKQLFLDSWFPIVFPVTNADQTLRLVSGPMPVGFELLMMEPEKRFPKLIYKLIDLVLSEDKLDSRMESMGGKMPDVSVLV